MTAAPPEVKLLCDEMLDRLGRFLRAAGYDTAIAAPGTPDEALLARAAAEGRVLVTCDRGIAARRTVQRVVVLAENGLDARARALGGPVRACPACGRLYWPGSHVRRMRAKLARWRGLTGGVAPPMLGR